MAVVLVFAVSCSGSGCGGCASLTTIPGGFPAAKRNDNAAQLRVSSGGLAAITANPAALVAGIIGGTGSDVSFNVPASCGGSAEICCAGGSATTPCGPLDIDLTKYPADTADRLDIVPEQGSDTVNITINARVKTATYIPITIPAISTTCRLNVDTMQGATTHVPGQDMTIALSLQFVQDATAGTTRVVVGTPKITLASGAITLVGDGSIGNDLECDGESFLVSALLSTIEGLIATQVQDAIQGQLCKACPTGTLDECGSFATSCTANVCDEGSGSGTCLQEIGLDGRALASALFASLSPGTGGAIDLYEVAGGYGTTDSNGIALGLLGGMEPAGSARDRCGPVSAEPAPVTIAPSAFFAGNTRPDTGAAFDVAIGLHKSQLDQFAYAAYDGGLLCLTIGHNTVAELSTATIGLLAHSLMNLNAMPAPVAVGLRPQSPPVITLGKNTFTTSGSATTLSEPLLDVKFSALELDFFAAVDDQYIRIFTVVADVDLPVGLQVGGTGELTPVLGDVTNAFTNLSVKNSEAVTETPAQLAAVFPSLLNLVLPQLSSAFSPIALPSIGGLNLSVTAITAVPQTVGDADVAYLAIFADLATPTTMMAVHTTAQLTGITEPSAEIAADPRRWSPAQAPTVTLALGGGTVSDLEFSYRIDSGLWSAWNTNARPTISSNVFWLAGTHQLEVRARRIGHPESIDRSPATLTVQLGAGAPPINERIHTLAFHGTTGAGAGCACDSSGGPGGAAPLAILVVLAFMMTRRSARMQHLVRRARSFGAVVWLAAVAALPGCSCHDAPCGTATCMTGDLPHGALGQWTSIAGDTNRVMVATYDQGLGDLVAVDATDSSNLVYVAVDGVPESAQPTYDPSTYRGGISDPGPDVGAWTSIILSGGTGRIAYQDRDATALKYAYEAKAGGTWTSYTIDPGSGEAVGQYASMTLDGAGNPAIAYLAIGTDDGSGHRVTELRLARTTSANPIDVTDWEIETIASAPGTCAGLCDSSQSCVTPAVATDPQQCVTATTDCATACGSGDVCVAGACLTEIAAPTVTDIPTGTGLFVKLVTLSNGQLVASYYDRTRRALILGVEAIGTPVFNETIIDGNVVGADRGMWASAVVDSTDTVHLAYQDALGDQLMYTTWNSATGAIAPIEVVDDGERPTDRPHPVGASSAIFLDNGSPAIAYQDGMTADVMLATRSGMTWATSGVATGPLLDGFSIGVTTGHGSTPVFAWDSLDPTQAPPNSLAIQSP